MQKSDAKLRRQQNSGLLITASGFYSFLKVVAEGQYNSFKSQYMYNKYMKLQQYEAITVIMMTNHNIITNMWQFKF